MKTITQQLSDTLWVVWLDTNPKTVLVEVGRGDSEIRAAVDACKNLNQAIYEIEDRHDLEA